MTPRVHGQEGRPVGLGYAESSVPTPSLARRITGTARVVQGAVEQMEPGSVDEPAAVVDLEVQLRRRRDILLQEMAGMLPGGLRQVHQVEHRDGVVDVDQ